MNNEAKPIPECGENMGILNSNVKSMRRRYFEINRNVEIDL